MEPDYAERSVQAGERASAYALVAWAFLENPDPQFVQRMLAWRDDPSATSPENRGGAAEAFRAGLLQMRGSLEARAGFSPEKIALELSVQRTRLFRGVAPGYGPPPPYEALYRGGDPMSEAALMLELRDFYREAAVWMAPGIVDRPDYLGLELDLMRVLCEEESRAWNSGDAAGAERARRIQKSFLSRHLLPWAPQFCETLLREPGVPFYHALAIILSGLLREEAGALGLEVAMKPMDPGRA